MIMALEGIMRECVLGIILNAVTGESGTAPGSSFCLREAAPGVCGAGLAGQPLSGRPNPHTHPNSQPLPASGCKYSSPRPMADVT